MQLLHVVWIASLAYVCRASDFDIFQSLKYLYDLKQFEDDLPYFQDDNFGIDKYDEIAPKEARDYGEAVLRDQEYMKQLPISGYQFISGGTGREEDPSQVKTDKVLPAYCTPPNPCPQGYTGGDNCVKDFENSPDKNRHLLEEQDCPCDAEHMLSCPPGKKTIDPKSGFVSDNIDVGGLGALDSLDNIDLSENPYMSTSRKRQKFIVKKSYSGRLMNSDGLFPMMSEELGDINPYLYGQQPKSVVKKMAPRNNK